MVTIVSAGYAAYSAQRILVARQADAGTDGGYRLFLPDGPSVRLLALGQQVTLADAYWLRFVQYIGSPEAMRDGLPQAFELADLITDVDPLYGYAYQAAGVALNSAKRLDESDAILAKGMHNVGDRWQLPFYLAFNHWYERNDLATGASYLQRAAAVPGAPNLVREMVARLSSAAGQADAAVAYFENLLLSTDEPGLRERLEERLLELRIERDLVRLEDLIAQYKAQFGAPPPDLDELVGRGLVAVPVSPSGSPYRYDPSTGQIEPPEGKRLSRPVRTARSDN